ncbi:putative ABC transporter permease [Paenibacillus sp. 598K]|nr:putative ABC transporter permease [Paenibacillus sp. 598K]
MTAAIDLAEGTNLEQKRQAYAEAFPEARVTDNGPLASARGLTLHASTPFFLYLPGTPQITRSTNSLSPRNGYFRNCRGPSFIMVGDQFSQNRFIIL